MPEKTIEVRVRKPATGEVKGIVGKTRGAKQTRAIPERTRAKARAERHTISLSLLKVPDQVLAGAAVELQLSVACSSGCDLKGSSLRIMEGEKVLLDGLELTKFDGTSNCTGEFSLQAPTVPGTYNWTVVFSPQQQGSPHTECLKAFTLGVKPHLTSMAVWDVGSPVEIGTTFRVKVGVNCLAGCNMGGKQVEVYDEHGANVAAAILSDNHFSDNVRLHWVELELKAPSAAGKHSWQARILARDVEVAHEGACHTFGFAAVKPADCEIAIEVTDKDSGAPIKNAEITLHPGLYQALTDGNGMAKVALASGKYRLTVFASEKAPTGIKYDFPGNRSGRLWITDGREYMLYVPEANKETMVRFQKNIKVEHDRSIKVRLVGVIDPRVKDTM